jgi:hypothetical protein
MYFRWLGNKLELTRTDFLASRRDRKITARLVHEFLWLRDFSLAFAWRRPLETRSPSGPLARQRGWTFRTTTEVSALGPRI